MMVVLRWGTISRDGVKIYSITLDTIGFYARSVADLQLLTKVFRINDDAPPPVVPNPLSHCKFAYIKTEQWNRTSTSPTSPEIGSGVSKELEAAWERSKRLLRAAGAEVVDIDMPPEFDDIPGIRHRYVQNGEARANFLAEYMMEKDGLDPLLIGHVENVTNISRRMQLDAYDSLAALRPVVDRLARQYDAIVTPSVPAEAPMGTKWTGDARFCSMWTILHVPCVNVPGFASENGMPIGLTLVAPRFRYLIWRWTRLI